MSTTLDKIDQLIERTNVSYTEAKDALEKTDGDVLEAIIFIESNKNNTASKDSSSAKEKTTQDDIKFEWKSEVFKGQLKFVWQQAQKIFKKMMQMKIAWLKNDKTYLQLPLLIVLLVSWFTMPFSLIVLIVPFFLGFNIILKTNGKKDKNISEMLKNQFSQKDDL